MPKHFHLLTLILTISCQGWAQAAFAQSNMQSEAMVEKRLKSARSLSAIEKLCMSYPGCSDGYFAEGVSDKVAKRMAYRWRLSLWELTARKSDRKFLAFVLQHLDATDDHADLRTVVRQSRSTCPPNAAEICRAIREAAANALRD